MKNDITRLNGKLGRYKAVRLSGLLLSELLRFAGNTAVVLTAYVFLDYMLAFSPAELTSLNTFITAVILVWLLIRISRILNIPTVDIARLIDRKAENSRQPVTCAYELGSAFRSDNSDSGMSRFLFSEVISDAERIFEKIRLRKAFPGKHFRQSLYHAAVKLCVAGVFLLLPYEITGVVLNRIFHPAQDIPPYSDYVFKLLPENPTVIYGGGMELSVKISGAPVTKPVLMLVRQGDSQSSTACFKGENNVYTQKIERITSSLNFCFTTGRARSKWREIKVLSIPKIALVRITVDPPSYTHLPERKFILGKNRLTALKGSEITLALTSNRPLRTGAIIISDKEGDSRRIKPDKVDTNTLLFKWKALKRANMTVSIRDILDTPAKETLKFKQFIIPDRRPKVMITEPDSYLLATPDAKITLKGYAEDDFGVKGVYLARCIAGYRDRIKFIGPAIVKKYYEFSKDFDLLQIGVRPGDIIELYAETTDFNPSLMGVDASDIIKIEIISKEEYADILRTRTKLENTFAGYNAAVKAFRNLKKELKNSEKQFEDAKLSTSRKKRIITRLKTMNNKIKQLLLKLTDNFPIYEMEKEQKEVFRDLYTQTVRNSRILDSIKPNTAHNEVIKRIRSMLKAFKMKTPAVEKIARRTTLLETLASLMNSAGRFSKLMTEQEEIVRRLSRFKLSDSSHTSGMLEQLAKREHIFSDSLRKLKENILLASKKLPSEYAKLRKDSEDFCMKLDTFPVFPELRQAYSAANAQRGDKAYRHASKALEYLRGIAERCKKKNNSFSGMMNGQIPGCISDSIKKTARQMLSSILRRNRCRNGGKRRNGTGAGSAGGDGDAEDGYSMGSSSPMYIPLAGPKRFSFGKEKSNRGGRTRGTGGNSRGYGKSTIPSDSREVLSISVPTNTETESISIDDVPLKYRNAVKKYFKGEK